MMLIQLLMKLLVFARQLMNSAKTVLKSKEEANIENAGGLIRTTQVIYRKKKTEEEV